MKKIAYINGEEIKIDHIDKNIIYDINKECFDNNFIMVKLSKINEVPMIGMVTHTEFGYAWKGASFSAKPIYILYMQNTNIKDFILKSEEYFMSSGWTPEFFIIETWEDLMKFLDSIYY